MIFISVSSDLFFQSVDNQIKCNMKLVATYHRNITLQFVLRLVSFHVAETCITFLGRIFLGFFKKRKKL